jgi:hypothetical protein
VNVTVSDTLPLRGDRFSPLRQLVVLPPPHAEFQVTASEPVVTCSVLWAKSVGPRWPAAAFPQGSGFVSFTFGAAIRHLSSRKERPQSKTQLTLLAGNRQEVF